MSIQANLIGENIDYVSQQQNFKNKHSIYPLFSTSQLRDFKPVLSFLNSKDRDILYLVFVSGKKQKHIQHILGRSQPSLCYDIKRIRKRLKYIFYLNSVFDIFIDFISNPPDVFSPFEIDVLLLMFYTSSFTLTSEILSDYNNQISQVCIRYCFDKCLRKMEEEELWEVYEIFLIIRFNLNLIRRVYRTGKTLLSQDIYIPQ